MPLVRRLFRRATETGEGNRILTPETVRMVRAMRAAGESQRAVARVLGIGATTVADIDSGRNWGWVQPAPSAREDEA